MSKLVIITGMGGQDGAFLAKICLSQEYRVVGVIRSIFGIDFDKDIKDLTENKLFSLIEGNITDYNFLENLIKDNRPDYFINLASMSFVGNSWKMPEETFSVNATSVIKILECIRKYKPDCRFFNAGSSEQFGVVKYEPQDENHPFNPKNPYGASKSAAHNLIRCYRESYGTYAIQGILYNHESHRRNEKFVTGKIVRKSFDIYKKIKENRKFDPIFLGNVNIKRDWSYAEDIMDGVWRMINQDSFNSDKLKDYVLCSGKNNTIKEFVDLSFKYFDIDGYWQPEKNSSLEEYVSSMGVLVKIDETLYRPVEMECCLGNPSLAKSELKWQNNTNLSDLITKMIDPIIKR